MISRSVICTSRMIGIAPSCAAGRNSLGVLFCNTPFSKDHSSLRKGAQEERSTSVGERIRWE